MTTQTGRDLHLRVTAEENSTLGQPIVKGGPEADRSEAADPPPCVRTSPDA